MVARGKPRKPFLAFFPSRLRACPFSMPPSAAAACVPRSTPPGLRLHPHGLPHQVQRECRRVHGAAAWMKAPHVTISIYVRGRVVSVTAFDSADAAAAG